ncbi:hypothetical protein [Campylobacter sp. VTCC 70190]|uniref:hypothetical protein n=1 Tax=Campylobacter sp. VTCC 70190 TaxID=3392118 RepID=UPI00398E3CCA
MNFLLGNFKLYLALISLAILTGYFYLKLESTQSKLSKARSDLNLALEANQQNLQELLRLKVRHESEIQALSEANKAKDELNNKIHYVNRYIYKEVKNGENNLTKLFNAMADRLWDANATSSD